MASAAFSFHSCSCGRNNEVAEQDDSTKTALEMENKLRQEPEFEIKTTHGIMKMKLYSQTPKHRDNFVKLVKEKYYDGIRFHRVIEGFMIQAGDPFSKDTALINSWGTGGPDYTIPAEFVADLHHKKGAIAAARKGDMANPKKASSVFGEVYEGLEVIDNIAMVDVDRYDRPYEDVIILSITQLGLPEEPKEEAADTTKAE